MSYKICAIANMALSSLLAIVLFPFKLIKFIPEYREDIIEVTKLMSITIFVVLISLFIPGIAPLALFSYFSLLDYDRNENILEFLSNLSIKEKYSILLVTALYFSLFLLIWDGVGMDFGEEYIISCILTLFSSLFIFGIGISLCELGIFCSIKESYYSHVEKCRLRDKK